MTAGTVNLLSLQCWASSLHDGVRVVEPFLRDGSHLGFETSLLRNTTLKERSGPKLLDIYNSWSWRCSTDSKRFSPLSTWEEFLSDAPRKIVIVGLDCKEEIRQPFYDSALQFSRDNGFEVVGEACMDGKHPLSAAKFREHVYNEHRPCDTVVLFNLWGGVAKELAPPPHIYRIALSDLKQCERDANFKKFMDIVPFSNRIVKNAEAYIQKYLFSKNGYLAVMVRLEQMFIRHHLKNKMERLVRGSRCVKGILKEVQRHRKMGLSKIFLAMDVGRFGSFTFGPKMYPDAHQLSRVLFRGLYTSGMSFKAWEDSFETVADFTKPGYVAMLQLEIAIRAEVLVLAGGGSFQSIADRGIRIRHSSDARIRHISAC